MDDLLKGIRLGFAPAVDFEAARIRGAWDANTETNRKRAAAGLPPLKARGFVVSVRCTAAEREALRGAAEAAGLPLSLWAVEHLLKVANHEGFGIPSGTNTGVEPRRLYKGGDSPRNRLQARDHQKGSRKRRNANRRSKEHPTPGRQSG